MKGPSEEEESVTHWVLTIDDVLPGHLDVLVAVGARLLVVKAQGMQQLELDRPVVEAALPGQGHHLLTPLTTHPGVAAEGNTQGARG